MLLPRAGWFALILPLISPDGGSASEPAKAVVESTELRGEVVKLGTLMKASGLSFDEEPVARQLVLRGDEGTVHGLISDEVSRALFLDERL